jgi:PIN domain nuclease of toxin-antitoxin system
VAGVATRGYNFDMLLVLTKHAIAGLEHVPPTRDPFDRLLLAICQVEGMRLATAERALLGHPLALDTKGAIP